MSEEARSSVTTVSLAIALLATPLAGCISGDVPSFDSYSDARSAEGVDLEAYAVDGTESVHHPVHLKTLHPADPLADTPVEETELLFLLYDEETDEPVTDAQITMDVHKSHEDHVAPSARTPTHTGNGIYEGAATFDKPEGWVVDLTITLSDGTTLSFPLHYHAGETDHTHPDHYHPEDHQHDDEHGDHEDEHDH